MGGKPRHTSPLKNPASLGLHRQRMSREPLERDFVEAWEKLNSSLGSYQDRRLLDDLVTTGPIPRFASKRDWEVASTVIQWLGSPIGQSFMREVYQEKEE